MIIYEVTHTKTGKIYNSELAREAGRGCMMTIQLVITIDGERRRAQITKASAPIQTDGQEVLTEGDSMNDIVDMIEAQILISQGRGNELGPDGRPVRAT